MPLASPGLFSSSLSPGSMRGSVCAKLGTGIWVENNQRMTGAALTDAKLVYDRDTTHSIACGTNALKM